MSLLRKPRIDVYKRQEYDTVIGENGYSLIYRNRPYDQEKNAAGMAANIEPDVDQARRQRLIIFIILLIVPAINLSSMTQSRLRQRVAEKMCIRDRQDVFSIHVNPENGAGHLPFIETGRIGFGRKSQHL